MRKQRNKFQMKEQEVTSEKELNEAIHTVYPIEFKVMIMKMLTKFRSRMAGHSQNFNKVRKYKEGPNS